MPFNFVHSTHTMATLKYWKLLNSSMRTISFHPFAHDCFHINVGVIVCKRKEKNIPIMCSSGFVFGIYYSSKNSTDKTVNNHNASHQSFTVKFNCLHDSNWIFFGKFQNEKTHSLSPFRIIIRIHKIRQKMYHGAYVEFALRKFCDSIPLQMLLFLVFDFLVSLPIGYSIQLVMIYQTIKFCCINFLSCWLFISIISIGIKVVRMASLRHIIRKSAHWSIFL